MGIKFLYSQGYIPMLHSCIKQTIETALSRFAELGLLETTSYLTKKGNQNVFLRCSSESRPKMNCLIQRLIKDRAFSKQHQVKIFEEVDEVIMRTQGPIPTPKL